MIQRGAVLDRAVLSYALFPLQAVFFCLCSYAICDIKRSYRSSLAPVEKWDVKINFTQLSQRVDLFWLAIWVIVDLFVYQYWSLWVSLGRWRYEKVTKPVQSHRLLSRCKRNYQGRNYRTSRSSANTHLSQEQLNGPYHSTGLFFWGRRKKSGGRARGEKVKGFLVKMSLFLSFCR